MTRPQILLLAFIGTEVCCGVLLGRYEWNRPTPPRPDLSHFDSATAEDLRAAADAGARSPEEWAALGEKYVAEGYYPEGEACYREASARKPDDAELAFKHGFALERLGLAAEADARYRVAIEHGHPRVAELWYFVGRNLLRLDDVPGAAEAFRQAGTLPAARFELAKVHARAKQFDIAGIELRRLADEFPQSHDPTTIQYRIAIEQGGRDEAARLADRFDRQAGRLPNPFDADYAWLEKTRESLGLRRRQKLAIESVVSTNPAMAERDLRAVMDVQWTPEAADQLAEVYFRKGRHADSVRVLEEAIQKAGPSFQLVWRLGDAYAAAGRPSDARREWERAAAFGTGPELKDLRMKLSDVYDKSGGKDHARRMQTAALLSPGIPYLDGTNLQPAYNCFKTAADLTPDSADAWYWLGEACRAGGRTEEAKAAYDRCLRLDPDHGRAERAARLLPK